MVAKNDNFDELTFCKLRHYHDYETRNDTCYDKMPGISRLSCLYSILLVMEGI